MGSMPRGSYKDQFRQRLYVQLNQGHNKLNYHRISMIQDEMQNGVDDYAHTLHDEADQLGMNKH
jgi:hypothetical protein